MRIDDNGNLDLYNATDSTALITGDGTVATTLSRASNNIGAGQNNFRKYRGTLAVPLAAATGDNIGTSNYSAWDGSSLQLSAQIAVAVDTFTGVNDISSNLKFFTRPTGSGATVVERLRIGPSGQIGIGGINYGTAGQVLTSGGPTAAVLWSSSQSIGIGQTWQNVLASRVAGTIYVNSTGRPIAVGIQYEQAGGSTVALSIDGVTVARGNQVNIAGGSTLSAIVPSGSSYALIGGMNGINMWAELR